jgi:hypothetical protein
MKIAILISGLVRYPEYGLKYLEKLFERSQYDVDFFCVYWSNDYVPENIVDKLKGCEPVPLKIKNIVIDNIYKNKNINIGNDISIEKNISSPVAHAYGCNIFKDYLVNYDIVFKWRWDIVIRDILYIDNIVRFLSDPINRNYFITDYVDVSNGEIYINDLLFAARSDTMIETFCPLEEKFKRLVEIYENDNNFYHLSTMINPHTIFPKMIISNKSSIARIFFKSAILRKNILNISLDILLGIDTLQKLQSNYDKEKQ